MNVNNIKQIKNSLTDTFVEKLVAKYFMVQYPAEDVEKALEEVYINIEDMTYLEPDKNITPPIVKDVSKVTVTIKGILLPIYRPEKLSVQDFIKQTLEQLFKNNLLSDAEISRLQDFRYCQNTFGIHFPLLQKKWSNCVISGHSRYWGESPDKQIGGFYVCSQWWKQLLNTYDEKIAAWLIKLEEQASKDKKVAN